MRECPSDNVCSDASRHCQKSAEAIVVEFFHEGPNVKVRERTYNVLDERR